MHPWTSACGRASKVSNGGAKRPLVAGDRYLLRSPRIRLDCWRKESMCVTGAKARGSGRTTMATRRMDRNERADAAGSAGVEPKLYEVQHLLNAGTLLDRRMKELADRD